MKRGTIKAFKELLNKTFPMESLGRWKNHRFHQRVREYGDYLYSQDRGMFDNVLVEALDGKHDDRVGWKEFRLKFKS